MTPQNETRPRAVGRQGASDNSQQLGSWLESSKAGLAEQAREAERISLGLHRSAHLFGGIASTQAASLAAHYGRVARSEMGAAR